MSYAEDAIDRAITHPDEEFFCKVCGRFCDESERGNSLNVAACQSCCNDEQMKQYYSGM